MRNKIGVIVIFATIIVWGGETRCEVLIMNDGRRIEGDVIFESEDAVRIDIYGSVITFNSEDIASINYDDEANLIEEEAGEVIVVDGADTRELVDEEEMRALGLVKYQNRWLAPDEIAKYRVRVRGRRLFVDRKPFFIKGMCYSISYPGKGHGISSFARIPFEVFEEDVKAMKEAGVNTIKTYESLPLKFLDLCEEYGLMVIENVIYPNEKTNYNSESELDSLKTRMTQNIRHHKKRPCILAWSIWNDMPFYWGTGSDIVGRYGIKKLEKFFGELYLAAKKEDPYHPIIGANALNSPSAAVTMGFKFLDIIGVNEFLGITEWMTGKFSEEEAKKQVKRLRDIARKYKKPVVITEMGYSSYCTEYPQDLAIEQQIKSAGDKLAGVMIFQWSDGWEKAGNIEVHDANIEEHWGILTGKRKKKPAYYSVSRMFNAIK